MRWLLWPPSNAMLSLRVRMGGSEVLLLLLLLLL